MLIDTWSMFPLVSDVEQTSMILDMANCFVQWRTQLLRRSQLFRAATVLHRRMQTLVRLNEWKTKSGSSLNNGFNIIFGIGIIVKQFRLTLEGCIQNV